MRYYLGLDAGGTKTFCLVGNEAGEVLGFGKAGAGNYEGYGVEAAAREIQTAVDHALKDAGISKDALSGVGMGVAGADLPEDYEMLEREIFGPLWGALPRVFRNDSMGGLRGGTRAPYGIVIACGTGCVCAGVNPEGQETRTGGINEAFGDKTTGTELGLEGLRAVWRAREGIRPPTLLTQLFLERSGCKDADELFSKVYHQEISHEELQPMAKLVFDAAYAGDATACDILEEGGQYLGEMVNATAHRLGMCQSAFDVIMAGSVFKGASPVLMDAMITRIHRECPQARPMRPLYEPVVGAFLLGLELDVTMSDASYEALETSLETLGARHGLSLFGSGSK